MKKRLLWLLTFVAMVAMLLTGCMRINESFVVSADGSASLRAEILFEKQGMLEAMKEMMEEDGETYNEEEMIKNLTENGYQIVTRDGKEYFSYTEEQEGSRNYGTLKELYRNDEMPFSSVIRPENNKNDYLSLTETSFEAAIPADAMSSDALLGELGGNDQTEAGSVPEEQLKKSEIYLSVTFATPVVKVSEGAVLSDDKKTVSFSVPLLSDKTREFYAYCENDIVLEGVKSGFIYGKTVSYTIPEGVTATLNGATVQGTVASEKTGTYDLCLKAADGTQKSIYYEVDKKAPVISNIKDNGVYSITMEIKISDAQSGVSSVTLDGKDILDVLEMDLGGDDLSELLQSYYYKFQKLTEGKHTLAVSDKLGNTSSITFQIDKTAPKVTGVKNNKTYKKAVTIKVTDKNGVKSITLNGKKIKSGKKVSKNGSYTLVVTDKAGNAKTIKFKIKK